MTGDKRRGEVKLQYAYFIEQIVWNARRTKGERHTITVLATSVQSAAELAGDNDGVHEIETIRRIGPIVCREAL
jgi:hypothetical protein